MAKSPIKNCCCLAREGCYGRSLSGASFPDRRLTDHRHPDVRRTLLTIRAVKKPRASSVTALKSDVGATSQRRKARFRKLKRLAHLVTPVVKVCSPQGL